ncbi:LamG domain-containing protein [Planobispora takensis]|uniref:LamG-like jellyroll fold domain-containing protein n=1 Tax=Planobispora takensis TaxID=1367882 RepID=A0A8J3SSD5_9ACTN|nr:LamG domain-containing protein [Planobispora takensis]GIH99758.1 hypothetical protein Pta02_17670 [Planobispora takensis]
MVAVVLLTGLLIGLRGTHASFTATAGATSAGDRATASFPTYPTLVSGDGPDLHHRSGEGPSGASASTADDAGAADRPGTYNGPTNGPMTWWQFDESAGATAADSSGGANAGTLMNGTATASPPATGPAWTAPGRRGAGAISLDGADDVVVGTDPAVRTDRSFTVSAWVYLEDKAEDRYAVSQDGERQSGFALQYSASLDRWALRMTSVDADTVTAIRAYSSSVPRVGIWTHLVAVRDRENGKLSLYVNGVQEHTVDHTASWNAAGPLTVGRVLSGGAYARYWKGMVDEVRVYSRAIGSSEITGIHRDSMKTRWEFDESAGAATTADSSGYGSTGTLTGGTFAAGRNGNAISLNGTGDRVSGASPVRTDEDFTAAAWVNLADITTDHHALAQQGTQNSVFAFQAVAATKKWRLRMATSDTGTGVSAAESTTTIQTGTWVHLAGVFEATAKRMSLYVNGTLERTATFGGTPWNAANGLVVGYRLIGGSPTGYWQGLVDRVRLYQAALPAVQIRDLYQDREPAGEVVPMGARAIGALQGAQQGLGTGTAMAFTGVHNAYAAYNPTPFAGPAAFTLECWVKAAGGSGGQVIGFNTAMKPLPDGTSDRVLYVDNAGRLSFGAGSAYTTIRSPAAITTGAWTHVAASLGTGGMKLYVNGVLVASRAAVTPVSVPTGYWRWGGASLAGWPNRPAGDYLTGSMDEVAVYPTQLSDQQISWHYHADH